MDFIHYSDSLLHIDLGGMEFDYEDIMSIISKGIRKSRTLLSCHLIGANNFGPAKFEGLMSLFKEKARFRAGELNEDLLK